MRISDWSDVCSSDLSACPGAEWVGDAGFAMARWGDHAYRLKGNVIPAGNPVHMNPEDIMRRLEILREEHRDLDTAIMALIDSGGRDQLQLARLKKRKLQIGRASVRERVCQSV